MAHPIFHNHQFTIGNCGLHWSVLICYNRSSLCERYFQNADIHCPPAETSLVPLIHIQRVFTHMIEANMSSGHARLIEASMIALSNILRIYCMIYFCNKRRIQHEPQDLAVSATWRVPLYLSPSNESDKPIH